MVKIGTQMISKAKHFILILLTVQIASCTGQVKKPTIPEAKEHGVNNQPIIFNQQTTFPQIHTNLNGMVREFVRTMHQDGRGNYWFGTNGDGIIRYDGKALEKMAIADVSPHTRVLSIVEDKTGTLWFGTSDGLIKYDGNEFTKFSKKEGLPGEDEEIWAVTLDKTGLLWVGSMGGVSRFDGEKFTPFPLPDSKVEDPMHMLSEKLVFNIIEDQKGDMWFVTDGNGIFKYSRGAFIHLTAENGLTDNQVADILEDKLGNIWIGTFYGGVSKFDGTSYTHFTQDGIIAGEEAYNFYEDRKGNLWFTAEGYGVYRYDGSHFKQFTTDDGLTSNVTLSILEDNKGQIWLGSWQGLCIYDGQTFVNAKDREPWTN